MHRRRYSSYNSLGGLSHPQANFNVNSMDGALNRVLRRFFTKCAQIIVQARSTAPQPTALTGKTDKWFSLESEELIAVRDLMTTWSGDSLPPLILETYVSASHLPKQRIVLEDGTESYPADKSEIVLERWVLEWRAALSPETDVTIVYKRAVVAIRCLFSLLRVLPTWALRQRIARQKTSLKLGFRIIDGTNAISSRGRVGLSKKIGAERDLQGYQFAPIESSAGSLHLSVSYRASANFKADDAEAVIARQLLLEEDQDQIRPASTSSSVASIGSALRPVVSFTRPFKEAPRRNPSSTSIHQQTTEPVPVPGGTPRSLGQSVSSSSAPRFSSSFARNNARFRANSTAASISSQSSLEPGSVYQHKSDVADFLKFVDDAQRKSQSAFHESVLPTDTSLARFQNLKSSSLGDSLSQLEASGSLSPPPISHSPQESKRRYSHIPATPSRLNEQISVRSSRSRLGFYDDDVADNEDDNDKDDDLVFAFRV